MYKREWTEQLEKKAQDELNEMPNKKEEDVKHIQDWLSKKPHLKARTDREWILNYLRGSKFNLQRTKDKLEYSCTNKAVTPEFYSNRDPLLPELQEILSQCVILPHSTKNEELIIVRWADLNPQKVLLADILKLALMILDITLMESSSYLIIGYHILIDLNGFHFGYLKQLSLFKKILYTLFKGYPVRVNGIYIFNTFSFFPFIFNILTPFMAPKIVKRIKVYGNYDLKEISKYVSVSTIPKEYGGDSESIYDIGEKWKTCLEGFRDWFLEEDESLGNNNQVGTYKKLEVE